MKIPFIILMLALSSCEEHISYELRILLKNETSNDILVHVYPKKEYMTGNVYSVSSIGGGHRDTCFDIHPNSEKDLYSTGDLTIHPDVLAASVFDSIDVVTKAGVKKELRFSPDTAIGYSENLYRSIGLWCFLVRNMDVSSSVKRTIVLHDYIFSVSPDKFR